ncbi:sensor histidine kinase [Cohnella cholangitidis]|uniref:histidine kinase n=1 Tax=Cohnella cholangitidis TaxID=2598458 RepID=A0A7G5BW18_9BACL|nr:HAMP domain-containing sensor histidine kinase [Cohnella cholangitidis]QMV41152.1 HAMP domain-containing histidine kinase [Cohnella cholangitidis]
MFNRIRAQLTIRNAAVLSVILIALNLSVFFIMKKMLFAQVDQSMEKVNANTTVAVSSKMINSESLPASAVPAQKAVTFRIGQMDRPIIQLFWTDEDEPMPMLGKSTFSEEQLKQLQPKLFGSSPKNVKVGDQYFRVLNIGDLDIPEVIGADGSAYRIVTQQLLSNVSAEIGMLRRLQFILLLGGSVGLLVAIAAGFYLANRSLIPIRVSLEKQQQFVSDASHELRTPLSVIQAHAELLLRHPGHTIEQDSKHVSTVLQEARRMSKLVGGLLTLARSDSNRLELERKTVQFDRIVQESVNKMQLLAEVKDIILNAEIDSPIPMNADEERLHQLLVTVLDNAIQYTPEGGVVRVVCRKFAHSVQLEVEDTGIGISPDDLPHVFDRFYRGDKARTRREGGSGLGLAIAQWIVERHGGKIRLESKLSTGTRVTVTLPI